MFHYQKRSLIVRLKSNSESLKFLIGQQMLPKCSPKLLLIHRHVEVNIWYPFRNSNSNFRPCTFFDDACTFFDADRPTLAEAPIWIWTSQARRNFSRRRMSIWYIMKMFSRKFPIKRTNSRTHTTIIEGPNLFGPKSSFHFPKKTTSFKKGTPNVDACAEKPIK